MNLKLVSCDKKYWEFVRRLRIDPKNQAGFLTYANITCEQQSDFMKKNAIRYRVCLLENKPVGYVGLVGEKEVTYCVDSKYAGKGIGTYMINTFGKEFESLEALVKPENIASQKVFEKLGYKKLIYYKNFNL